MPSAFGNVIVYVMLPVPVQPCSHAVWCNCWFQMASTLPVPVDVIIHEFNTGKPGRHLNASRVRLVKQAGGSDGEVYAVDATTFSRPALSFSMQYTASTPISELLTTITEQLMNTPSWVHRARSDGVTLSRTRIFLCSHRGTRQFFQIQVHSTGSHTMHRTVCPWSRLAC